MHCCDFMYNAVTLYTLCWVIFQYYYNLIRVYEQFALL